MKISEYFNERKNNDGSVTIDEEMASAISLWLSRKDIQYGKCKHCSKPFILRSKNQKFCFNLNNQGESKCAVAYRQKKYRNKGSD